MTALEILQETYGETTKPTTFCYNCRELNELLKYTNFVAISKPNNAINSINSANINKMSLYAIKETSKYSPFKKGRLNITK